MMSPQQVPEIWAQSVIVRASANELETVEIPQEAKQLLVGIGLPKEAELNVSFTLDEGVTTLGAFAEEMQVAPPHDAEEFIRIGTDGGAQICLAIGSGSVFAIDPSGRLPRRFVNSSLLAFLELLSLYGKYAEKVQELSEDEAYTLVDEVTDEMRRIDSAAFEHPENWWSVIVQQMRDGLL